MERAARDFARAARAAKGQAKREAEADKAAERAGRKAQREEARAERVRAEILPPLPDLAGLGLPENVTPLDFLQGLMRHPDLPLGFRRDCAALALPYAHAKPILGLKDARAAAAFLDDGDDELAAAMRG